MKPGAYVVKVVDARFVAKKYNPQTERSDPSVTLVTFECVDAASPLVSGVLRIEDTLPAVGDKFTFTIKAVK